MKHVQVSNLGIIFKKNRAYIMDILKSAGLTYGSIGFYVSMMIIISLTEAFTMMLLVPLSQIALFRDYGSALKISRFLHIGGMTFDNDQTNMILFGLVILLIFLSQAFQAGMKFYSQFYIEKKLSILTHEVRIKLLRKYFSYDKSYFDNHKQVRSRIVTVVSQFTYSVQRQINSLLGLVLAFMFVFVYLILMFCISWQLTVMLLVGFPPINACFQFVISKIKKNSLEQAKFFGNMNSRVSDIFNCLTLVKSSCMEDQEVKGFEKVSNDLKMSQFRMAKKAAALNPLREIAQTTTLLLFVVILAVVVRFFGVKDMSKLVVFFVLLRRTSTKVGSIPIAQAQFAAVMGEVEEVLRRLFDKNTDKIISGNKCVDGLRSGIMIKGLNFNYNDESEILNDINIFFPKGKTTAIVGETGAGKSTLVSLLLRLYDCPTGTIFWDDVDIKEFDINSIRSSISYLSQDVPLFNRSLRFNILYGIDRDVPEDELGKALQMMQLDDLVSSLPGGLDTVVGRRGETLSGGEKQRIALLRSLLNDVDVMILDEATSSLDSITERIIQESIHKLTRHRTSIVIAHRLSTVKEADSIVVIEKGEVAEKGTLDELLDRKGAFYRYWEEQKFD